MMKIRQFTDKDNISDIEHSYPMPGPQNIIIGRAVDVNDKLSGYGIVKHHAEAMFEIDRTLPPITRMRALKELMHIAIFGASNARCEQLHVFVKDRRLADYLKKHFGFVETKDIVLAKEL
jgi:hypothetical protein